MLSRAGTGRNKLVQAICFILGGAAFICSQQFRQSKTLFQLYPNVDNLISKPTIQTLQEDLNSVSRQMKDANHTTSHTIPTYAPTNLPTDAPTTSSRLRANVNPHANSSNTNISTPQQTETANYPANSAIPPKSQVNPHLNMSTLDKFIQQPSTPPSLKILFESFKTHQPPHAFGETITTSAEEEISRCARYGWQYNPERKSRRRIFFGSNIADDSWHPIAAHAAEAYGLYHTVAFIEGTITTGDLQETAKPRKLRFVPAGSVPVDTISHLNESKQESTTSDSDEEDPLFNLQVLQSGIYGPDTKVTVDLYVDNPDDRTDKETKHVHMIQEHLQRDQALKRWKMNGMTEDDIAIFSDTDEFYSRDFLLAAMTCDVPQFRKGQDCRNPKLLGQTLQIESSPECIVENRQWYHPDMMIGACVDTIGNATLHPTPERTINGKGKRLNGYGMDGNYSLMPSNTTNYPLWRTSDFRTIAGGDQVPHKTSKSRHSAFHVRNFFLSMSTLRRKFATYTHANPEVDVEKSETLSVIQEELNMTINCVLERPETDDALSKRLEGGFDAIQGDTPILFRNKKYRIARQEELRDMILEDEAKFGSNCPACKP